MTAHNPVLVNVDKDVTAVAHRIGRMAAISGAEQMIVRAGMVLNKVSPTLGPPITIIGVKVAIAIKSVHIESTRRSANLRTSLAFIKVRLFSLAAANVELK